MKLRHRTTIALLVSALALSACGSDNQVGDQSLLNFDPQEAERLGVTSTTEAPSTEGNAVAAAATEPGDATAGQAPSTTALVTTTTAPEQRQVSLEVAIRGDNQGTAFEPSVARVFVGSIIRFRNIDSQPRSVRHTGGSFDSGEIAPGGFWDYEATTAGVFDYVDGTRPYAVGKIEVLSQ